MVTKTFASRVRKKTSFVFGKNCMWLFPVKKATDNFAFASTRLTSSDTVLTLLLSLVSPSLGWFKCWVTGALRDFLIKYHDTIYIDNQYFN